MILEVYLQYQKTCIRNINKWVKLMIRLIQRRLIIPRGDTGEFSIPAITNKNTGDVAIFTIFDPLTQGRIL